MENMSSIRRKFWSFYLLGREERRLRNDLDPAVVARKILEEEEASLPAMVTAACAEVGAALTARTKKNWLAEHEQDLKAIDGDPEEAYRAWVAGRVDELASAVDSSVVAALSDQIFEEE
jgi:hypothetical protein